MVRCAELDVPKKSSKEAKGEICNKASQKGKLDIPCIATFFKYYDLIQNLWNTMACSHTSLVVLRIPTAT